MPTLHVLIAHGEDIDHAYECAQVSGRSEWIMPKAAVPDDDVALFHWGEGIFAIATVQSSPVKAVDGPWAGRYRASIGNVRILQRPLILEDLAEEFPEWNWVRYPKMYTTPAEDIAAGLRELFVWDEVPDMVDVDLMQVEEGGVRLAWHLVAERNAQIIDAKKADVLRKTGTLACEVCAFDFRKRYGERGDGFCEVHHLNPLSERVAPEATSLSDLAIVCSNCHRMAHRGPLLGLEQLRSLTR